MGIDYMNSKGEQIIDYHFIDIYKDLSKLSEIPSEINLEYRTLDQDSEKDVAFRILKWIKGRGFTEGTAGILSLMALSFPLAFTFIIGLNLHSPIDRNKIQQIFYIQCMYASPVFLTFLIAILSTQYLIPGGAMGFSDIDLPLYFLLGSILLWFAFAVWHLVVEIKYISDELGVPKRRTARMVVSLLVIYYLLIFGTYFFSETFGNTPFYISILFCLVIVVGVPLFKRYSKKTASSEDQ
jgi:hypothetical protein